MIRRRCVGILYQYAYFCMCSCSFSLRFISPVISHLLFFVDAGCSPLSIQAYRGLAMLYCITP